MLDLNRTVRLVRGALFDAEATWRSYLPTGGEWQKTAFLLTGPLILASAAIGVIVALLGLDRSPFGLPGRTFLSALLAIPLAAIGAVVVAGIFGGLAGAFGGKRSFALGLAATTLAFVPVYLGGVITWLPWVGGLLALALVIYALVLLWRIIPIYLEVPDGKRAGHYVVSLLATFVVMLVLSTAASRVLYGSGTASPFADTPPWARSGNSDGPLAGTGLFGDTVQRGQLMAAAHEDRYTPPPSRKLTEEQVVSFIRLMDRATEIREDAARRVQEMARDAQRDQTVDFGEFSRMVVSANDIGAFQAAEVEVVKTGGGNWAEHEWVRNALRTAWIQSDGDEAVAHNHALYLKYEDRLARYVTR